MSDGTTVNIGGQDYPVPPEHKDLLDAQMALNRLMLETQLMFQALAQEFSTESNAAKAGHDAAMNSIRNVRS